MNNGKPLYKNRTMKETFKSNDIYLCQSEGEMRELIDCAQEAGVEINEVCNGEGFKICPDLVFKAGCLYQCDFKIYRRFHSCTELTHAQFLAKCDAWREQLSGHSEQLETARRVIPPDVTEEDWRRFLDSKKEDTGPNASQETQVAAFEFYREELAKEQSQPETVSEEMEIFEAEPISRVTLELYREADMIAFGIECAAYGRAWSEDEPADKYDIGQLFTRWQQSRKEGGNG